MEETRIDSLIRETLEQSSFDMPVSTDLQKQIKQQIRSKSEEEIKMRHLSKRKIMVVAAALCLVGSIAAVAAGQITGYRSSVNIGTPDYKNSQEIADASGKLGCPVKAVDTFRNGYQFEKGFLVDVEGIDENGNRMEVYPEVVVDYRKENKRASLSIQHVSKRESEGNKRDVVIKQGDITMRFSQDTYKMVVPEYQATEEELAAVERGDLFISYGADENYVELFNFLSWEQDGAGYMLMSSGDGLLEQSELITMANELIAAK